MLGPRASEDRILTAKATVRVTTEDGQPGKPDRSRLEAAAGKLAERGFQVMRIGRFGVNIEGPESAFEKELGVHIRPEEALVAPAQPAEPELSKLIDLVEVASVPTSFAE